MGGKIGNERYGGDLNTDDEVLEVGFSERARLDDRVKHAIENDG